MSRNKAFGKADPSKNAQQAQGIVGQQIGCGVHPIAVAQVVSGIEGKSRKGGKRAQKSQRQQQPHFFAQIATFFDRHPYQPEQKAAQAIRRQRADRKRPASQILQSTAKPDARPSARRTSQTKEEEGFAHGPILLPMPSARALLRIPAALAAPAALLLGLAVFSLPACSEQTGPTSISLHPTLSTRTKAMGWGDEREQLLTQTLEFEVGTWEQPKYPRAWHQAQAQDQALVNGRIKYQNNCAECHGWTGRGDGERAADLHRPPRDFSLGFTKYKNTLGSSLPLRADLAAYLNRPLTHRPADACPSLLADDSLELLYIEFLLMRNAVEIGVVGLLNQVGVFATSTNPIEQEAELLQAFEVGLASVLLQRTAKMEADAVNRRNNPAATAPLNEEGTALIGDAQRGKQLFTSAKAACATCHGVDGKGKGPQSWEPALGGWVLKDMWGNPAIPGDFTTWPLRGGDTEVDLWRSISVGVGGTPMPSFGTTLSQAQIADLVAYIQSFAR